MKVCYVISTPSVAGGANRALLDIIHSMHRQFKDFSCVVIMSAHGTMEETLQNLGIRTYVFPFANAIKDKKKWRTVAKQIYNIQALPKLKKILKEEKVDVLHNNSLPTTLGMEAAFGLGIPYISHIRENVWDGLGMDFYAPRKVKKIMEHAAVNIAISEYIRKSYETFSEESTYKVIYDGIVTEQYVSPDRPILQSGTIKILMVGVINPNKGQKDAVTAVEELHKNGYNNIKLTIVGSRGRWNDSTAYADELMAHAKEKSADYIKFLDAVNELDELKRIREQQDINLICSSAEGLGRTTIESMLSGAVTIAADAGATPEILTDGETGLMYQRGDVKELAAKIEWVIRNTDTAKRIARQGQKEAMKRFGIEQYTVQLNTLYKECMINLNHQ